jgi:hypothetical protein
MFLFVVLPTKFTVFNDTCNIVVCLSFVRDPVPGLCSLLFCCADIFCCQGFVVYDWPVCVCVGGGGVAGLEQFFSSFLVTRNHRNRCC